MKARYKVLDKKGRTLCFQDAKSDVQAVEFAKMYGHKGADSAEYYREAM